MNFLLRTRRDKGLKWTNFSLHIGRVTVFQEGTQEPYYLISSPHEAFLGGYSNDRTTSFL